MEREQGNWSKVPAWSFQGLCWNKLSVVLNHAEQISVPCGTEEHFRFRRVSTAANNRETTMKQVYALALVAALTIPAFAAETMSSLPSDSWTITNYYKQDVYDKGQNTVGKIDDVLVDKSGKITALMVGVGGFLSVGEKDVALPFTAVHSEKKNNKWYLTVGETKDSLKSATGYKYDSSTTTWAPDKK